MDSENDIRKKGYLKKQKTMKKKLFVLKEESDSGSARLEYYDSEKKFSLGRPKRSISLHNCFSINSKSDAKSKHAIVLYTREDCFTVVCENEEEKNDWLGALVDLRNYHTHGGGTSHIYEHIWPVTVKSKGLGSSKHLMPGQYRLCLTTNELSFVRPCLDQPDLVLHLACIRRCGHTECFFYLELGRTSVTGSGDLWMQVEDIVIAQNMHETILSLMTTSNALADQPQIRPRRHSNVDKVPKPSHTPNRQRSTPSGQNTTSLPQRSNTISTADHVRSPLKRRLSQSPSKAGTAGTLPRPRTISGHSTLPPSHTMFSVSHSSFGEDPRSRTDSMESTGSRTTNSVSADDFDSPPEDLVIRRNTSTPRFQKPEPSIEEASSYVPMEANVLRPKDHSVSPVTNANDSNDYMEIGGPSGQQSSLDRRQRARDQLKRTTAKIDDVDSYMEMGGNSQEDDAYMNADNVQIPPSVLIEPDCYMEMGGKTSAPIEEDPYMDVSGIKTQASAKVGASGSDYAEMGIGTRRSPAISEPKPERKRNDSEYIPMIPQGQFLPIEDSSYMDMARSSSTIASSAVSSSSSLHEISQDFANQRATGGQRSYSVGEEDEYFEVGQDSGYLPMEARSCSPRATHGLRPDRVTSYLADESSSSSAPQRSYSVGSRQQVPQKLNDSYLDMNGPRNRAAAGKGHQKTSSAPLLNHGAIVRSQSHGHRPITDRVSHRSKTLDRPISSTPVDSSRDREEKDFLMEMTFQQKRTTLGKDHDYEEIRPRTSSGGPHDLHNSTERKRSGSLGYREKLSKFASLARASVMEYKKSDVGHRPRIATISQDTFRNRTSSFGNADVDMRPRSSSHGNSRYVDMSGRLRRDISSQNSSHDSLQRSIKRPSHDSMNSTASEYLDMRPRVSTSPSQALVATFIKMEKSRQSPRSPLPTDSDYLSMEPGKSSSESSEYASMELPTGSSRTVDGKARTKSRSKRGSVSSGRASHSSSESLTSNNSQSSEGRGPVPERTKVKSTTAKTNSSLKPSSAVRQGPPTDKAVDDPYVLYSPSSSRESSPHPDSKLDKVSCPLRLEKDETVPSIASKTSHKGDSKEFTTRDGHQYVNVAYDEASANTHTEDHKATCVQTVEPSVSTNKSGPGLTTAAGSGPGMSALSRPVPKPSAHVQSPPKLDVPSRPCPQAPHAVSSSTTNQDSSKTASLQLGDSKQTPCKDTTRYIPTDESDYLLIEPQSSVSKRKQSSGTSTDVQTSVQPVCLPRQDAVVEQKDAKPCDSTESDYLMVNPRGSEKVDKSAQGASSQDTGKIVKPRPRLPSMPVPFPSLGIVSPTASKEAGSVTAQHKSQSSTVQQDQNSDSSGYMELSFPQRRSSSSYELDSATKIAPPLRARIVSQAPPRVDQGSGDHPALGTSTQLSMSKSSLNSVGEKELNYATLDLQSCTDDCGSSEPVRGPKHASGGSSAGSDSPDEAPMQYAQIDFKKSQELRTSKRTRPPFDL